ncbi:MAG: hypothetical protein AAF414_11360 [Pseudomonadota bacterium]
MPRLPLFATRWLQALNPSRRSGRRPKDAGAGHIATNRYVWDGVLVDGGGWHLVERLKVNRADGRAEIQLVLAPKKAASANAAKR